MEVFRYEVIDSAGKELKGNIQAASVDVARRLLTDAGYRVRTVGGDKHSIPAQAVTTRAAARTVAQTVSRPITRPAVSVPVTKSPAVAPADTVKTAYSKEMQLYLLFSQLSSLFRSGVSPGVMFKDLSVKQLAYATLKASPLRAHNLAMGKALRQVGADVEAGKSLAAAMSRYPYLFPEDIVSTVEAGEKGGFLPEALQDIADQREGGLKVKSTLRWFVAMLGAISIVTPITFLLLQASGATMIAQDKAGGSLPPVDTFLQYGRFAFAKGGWLVLLAILAIPLGQILLGSWKMRKVRHQTVLLIPLLAGRIKSEATHRFCWALQNLSKAGISPNEVFRLSAACVPNLVLRDQLMSQAKLMRENEPLSQAIQRTAMLPPEYVDVIANGELTGDVPKALGEVGKATGIELSEGNRRVSSHLRTIALVTLALLILPILATAYRTHYGNIYKAFDTND